MATPASAKVVPIHHSYHPHSPSFSPVVTPSLSPRLSTDSITPYSTDSPRSELDPSPVFEAAESPHDPRTTVTSRPLSLAVSSVSASHPHLSASTSITALSSLSSLPSSSTSPTELRFLCFDLQFLSPVSRFLFLSSGIFCFFILNSYLEEFIFRQLPHFTYGWYLTQFELTLFALFALIERRLTQPAEALFSRRASYRFHLYVAVAMTASRGLTNVSLQFLNYPTQVIFKSMKLLTVMAGSLCILHQSFHPLEYVCAACLVASACLFSYGDFLVSTKAVVADGLSTGMGESLYVGVVIVLLSLVADAFHATTQDTLMRAQHASTLETMLFTNAFSSLLALLVTVCSGELIPAFAYCLRYPAAYPLFVLRAVIIYLGVLCFLLTIKSFGVVRATAVTTVRKILTVLLSFVLFPKGWSAMYVWGFVAFSVGLLGSVYVSKQTGGVGGKGKREEEVVEEEEEVEMGEQKLEKEWLLAAPSEAPTPTNGIPDLPLDRR